MIQIIYHFTSETIIQGTISDPQPKIKTSKKVHEQDYLGFAYSYSKSNISPPTEAQKEALMQLFSYYFKLTISCLLFSIDKRMNCDTEKLK